MRQIIHIVESIERLGHAVIPVADLQEQTKKFLIGVNGCYYVYLPAPNSEYIITRSAPDGKPHKDCGIQGLGQHNRFNLNWI